MGLCTPCARTRPGAAYAVIQRTARPRTSNRVGDECGIVVLRYLILSFCYKIFPGRIINKIGTENSNRKPAPKMFIRVDFCLSRDSFHFGKSAFRGTRLPVSLNSFLFGNRILFQNRSYEKFSRTRKFTGDQPRIPKRSPFGSITKSYMNSFIKIVFFRDLGGWAVRAISRDQTFSPPSKCLFYILFEFFDRK